MIIKNDEGKVVGVINEEDSLYIKKVNSVLHRLHYMNGYAIDEGVVALLQQKDIGAIIVYEKDTGKKYEISTKLFLQKCREINHGHGKQLAVSLSEFREITEGTQGVLL